jgi:cell division protein FtsL
MAIVFWLILYGQNISLDYQIYKLKNSITQSEEKLADLQEELASAESLEKIIKWAEENNFVKVNNVSYLNLKEENLAQSPLLRF